MPIDFNVLSSNCRTSIIFLLNDSGFPASNKKPVLSLIIVSPSPWYFGFLGNIYGLTSSLLTIVFIYLSWNVYRKKIGSEPILFKYSILYLFL